MRDYILVILIAAALGSGSAFAGTIVVDAGGGGDYDNIPEAAFHAAADDTVLVLPGTYAVGPAWFSWPIPLTADSPTFLSQSGAAVTILEGDGTLPAFGIAPDADYAVMFVHGFTFRSLTRTVARDGDNSAYGPVHFTDNIVECVPSTWPALDAGGGPDGMIARNTFVGTGDEGITLHESLSGWIEDNDVSGYFFGITGAGLGVEIRRNHIHDCQSCGITAYGPLTAYDNLIEGNSYAGVMLDGTASLVGNVIRGNGVGVTWPGALFNTPGGYARSNDIYDNDVNLSVPLILGYSVTFDATMNWWGTTDPEEIADGIWDCNDELGGECCVDFLGWCTEPIPGCNPTSINEDASWGAIKAIYR